MLSFSQEKLRDTSEVRIKYIHQVAATKAFIELRYYKTLDSSYILLTDIKNAQIKDFKHSVDYYKSSYETLDNITIPSLKAKSKEYEKLYSTYKTNYKREKTKGIILGSTLPPITFVLGFTIAYLLLK